jgi:hypothetical protein
MILFLVFSFINIYQKQKLKRSQSMRMIKNGTAETSGTKTGPAVILQRIGSTRFEVNVYFSEKDTEKLEEKVLRLIKREVSDIA